VCHARQRRRMQTHRMLPSGVDSTVETLARLRKLAQSMAPKTAPVDEALPAVRTLFADAGVPFKLVGGIAVVDHGYARMTEDIHVLVDGSQLGRIDACLATNQFIRESRTRLRHTPTGVRVDLLIGGEPGPRPGDPPYPAPGRTAASPRDAAVVGLAPLIELKVRAGRHQDLADIVALLKPLDDGRYIALEAEVARELRTTLADLRRDALEELAR
jgi:hypothetical protein